MDSRGVLIVARFVQGLAGAGASRRSWPSPPPSSPPGASEPRRREHLHAGHLRRRVEAGTDRLWRDHRDAQLALDLLRQRALRHRHRPARPQVDPGERGPGHRARHRRVRGQPSSPPRSSPARTRSSPPARMAGARRTPSASAHCRWRCWPPSCGSSPACATRSCCYGVFTIPLPSSSLHSRVAHHRHVRHLLFIGVLYLERIRGYGALTAGLAFLPQTLLLAALSLGPIAWLRLASPPAAAARGLQAAPPPGFARCCRPPGRTPPMRPRWSKWFLLIGLGAGMSFMPLLTIAMAKVPVADAGLASGIVNTSPRSRPRSASRSWARGPPPTTPVRWWRTAPRWSRRCSAAISSRSGSAPGASWWRCWRGARARAAAKPGRSAARAASRS